MGRMLLTALDDAELSRLYQHIRLDDYPAPAPRTLPELQAMTMQDRERGWVLHRSDYSTAIATSIKDHAGKITAAINLSGPDAIMDPDGARERFQDLLLACSERISSELGYRP
jgi:DNA-binding IclR family transcriptional regulator